MFDSDFEQLAERLRRSLVQVSSGGSGIVWARDHIVTNAHVVRGEESVDVRFADEHRRARVLWRDRARDLAVLYASPFHSAAVVEVGCSGALRPGELVLAVGNPLGISGAVTAGIIHSIGPAWIEADVRLAPGNSGGILADAAGRVIGVTAMIMNGLALAVPAHDVATVLERLHLRKTA